MKKSNEESASKKEKFPIKNPHNNFVAKLFENKKLAKNYFRSRLPDEIVKDIDWRTLKPSKVSWVDDQLKAVYSDINFTVKWKQKDIYLPLVLEHQSSRPPVPHLKMARYLLNGYDYQIEQIENAKREGTMKKGKAPKLTVIIPLFLYNGQESWDYKSFDKYFDPMDEHLIDFIPNFKYLLDNLRTTSNEELFQQKELGLLASAFLLLKNYKDKDYIVSYSAEIFGLAYEYSEGGGYFEVYAKIAMSYLTGGVRMEEKDVEKLIESIDEPVLKNPIMNAIESYQLKAVKGAKREFVISLLKKFPNMSNAEIGEIVNVSEYFVRKIKKEIRDEK